VWTSRWLCRALRPQGRRGMGEIHHRGHVCQGSARRVTPEFHRLGRARAEERLRTGLRNELLKALPNNAVTTRSPGTLASAEASARHRLPWLASVSAWLENEAVLGYVLMTPALLLIVVFIAYPFSLGVGLSLTDKLVGKPAHFIGLRNFTHLFESQIFRTTIWNTVFFTVSATVLKAVLGMWLAVLLNRKIRFARFIRASVLLPFIVPTVLSGPAWLLS